MEFGLTEEHRMFQKLGKDFSDREIEPIAEDIEKEGKIPPDMLGKLASVGLLGMTAPDKCGGLETGFLTYMLAVEQLHYTCTPCSWLMVSNEFAEVLVHAGTETQQAEFIPSLVEGQAIASVSFAGYSDETGHGKHDITCRQDNGHWVINGVRRLDVFGHLDGPAIILARADGDGPSAFVVSKTSPGYRTSEPLALLGLRGLEVVNVSLEDVRVPESHLLGGVGDGERVARLVASLSSIRQSIQAVACAQRALDEAVKYSKERTRRGVPIAAMQAVQWLLAETAMRLEPARWAAYEVGAAHDRGLDTRMEAAKVKLFAARTARDAANMAIQVHGCYGLTKDYRIERIYRQAKMFELTEGSSDQQRAVVADALLAV